MGPGGEYVPLLPKPSLDEKRENMPFVSVLERVLLVAPKNRSTRSIQDEACQCKGSLIYGTWGTQMPISLEIYSSRERRVPDMHIIPPLHLTPGFLFSRRHASNEYPYGRREPNPWRTSRH
jgi:hypothetical protein